MNPLPGEYDLPSAALCIAHSDMIVVMNRAASERDARSLMLLPRQCARASIAAVLKSDSPAPTVIRGGTE